MDETLPSGGGADNAQAEEGAEEEGVSFLQAGFQEGSQSQGMFSMKGGGCL